MLSRSHFAVSPRLGRVVFRLGWRLTASQASQSVQPLVELRLRLQSAHRYLASPPQRSGISHGLPTPFSTFSRTDPQSMDTAASTSVRPQGLATLSTAYALCGLAGLVSCRQRSWDSPFEAFPSHPAAAAFPPKPHPHTVSPVLAPRTPEGMRQPATRAAVSGRSERESLAWPVGLGRADAGCSLGLCTFQGTCTVASVGISPDIPSRACPHTGRSQRAAAPQGVAQRPPRPTF